MPHLLTDEQKRQRVKVAIKLLQMFPTYDKKQFDNVVSGDETWVSIKIWAIKHNKRPLIAKRSLSEKSRNKSVGEKGQKHHWKVLQSRST